MPLYRQTNGDYSRKLGHLTFPSNFPSSTYHIFGRCIHQIWSNIQHKVVGLPTNFPMHQESPNSDFFTKSYGKNTKAYLHVYSFRNLCWLSTCSSIFSRKDTESEKVFFIRVVALSLSFKMVGGSYFSDFSTESNGQNTKGCQDELKLNQAAVWAEFGPFAIGFGSWVLHEHCSPMS